MCIENSNLFSKLLDLNVLYDAFQKCKRNVYWKCSIQSYEARLLLNLYKLKKSLKLGKYKQHPFYEFDICERGKHRHIKALHINDRVLQRALCDQILLPILSPYLIYDNGANVPGKGVDFTKRRFRDHLHHYYQTYHTNKGYILQIDIKSYFDSMPHDKVVEVMCEHINDTKVCKLIKDLVNSYSETGIGVGIGSQLSQLIGTYYLHGLDDYIKIVKGYKYYARYTDDMYIIDKDKDKLKQLLEEIKQILSQYGLKINEKKTRINKLDRKIPFLKVRYILTDAGKVIMIPSKETFTRERHKLKFFKKLYDTGEMSFKYIERQFKGWQGTIVPNKNTTINYKSFHSVQNINTYFNTLYRINEVA